MAQTVPHQLTFNEIYTALGNQTKKNAFVNWSLFPVFAAC